MADFRVPGPVCREQQPWSIQDGTLALRVTPFPGTICAALSFFATTGQMNRDRTKREPDLGFLFLQCSNPEMGLSEDDYSRAAVKLGVEVAAIKAVAKVETAGKAFDESGRPRILFERHYFHRLTSGKYSAKHPDISNADAGAYGKFSAQYGKLERAFKLDADAALSAASWGRFQIMGANFRAAGFSSVRQFAFAMSRAESEHLKAFVHFVGSDKAMLEALRKKNWAAFASRYNGPAYKKNKYDEKMKEEYERQQAMQAGSADALP